MAIVEWFDFETGLAEGASGGEVYSLVKHEGNYAYRVPQSSSANILLSNTDSELWVSAWVYVAGFGSSRTLLSLYSGSDRAGGVALNTDGRLFVFDRTGAQVGTVYTGATLAEATWYHVQLHLAVGAAATVEVRLSNALVIEETGVDTRPGGTGATVDRIVSITNGSGMDTILDDIVVDDAAWPGDQRGVLLLTNGAGTTQDFTRSDTGIAHHEHVDDFPPDTGGSDKYVYSSTVGHLGQFAVASLPSLSGNFTVVAVRPMAVMSESSAAGHAVDTGLHIPGGANSPPYEDNLDHLLQTSQTLHKGLIRETNPDTGVAWVDTDLTDLQVQVEVV
jgi:hypothetical protein